MAMSAVMILVVLAIGCGLSPFRSNRVCPVSLSSSIASFAVISVGLPFAVRMGVGFGGGVGVNGRKVGDREMVACSDPPNSRPPSGVKASTGTAINRLIAINSRIIAIMRRIIGSMYSVHTDYLYRFCYALYRLRPLHMVIGHALEGVSDAQDSPFGEEVAQQLQADGETLAEASGNGDAAYARQVCRDGEHVLQVHLVGVGYLTQLEGYRGRGRADQHIEAFKGAGEVLRNQRAHLLRAFVIGVVVAGRERVGAQHDTPLDLLAETVLARLLQRFPHVGSVAIGIAVFHAVIASEVRTGLGRGNDVVHGYGVFCVWQRYF